MPTQSACTLSVVNSNCDDAKIATLSRWMTVVPAALSVGQATAEEKRLHASPRWWIVLAGASGAR
jgi:hypothetical protein